MPITRTGKQLVTILVVSLFSIKLIAQPSISSISPASGPVGSSVTISGSNFSATPANNIVFFGAGRATVTGASATSLTVSVPAGATYQPITVTTGGLTAYSARPFIVTFTGGGGIASNTFGPRQDFTTDLRPNAIALADFDGDGKTDVATPNNYNTAGAASVSVLRNTSSGGNIAFAPKQDFVTGPVTYAIAAGDIDGDGKPDMVSTCVANATASIFRNTGSTGTISFAPKIDIVTGTAPFGVCIGDIDNDGKPDLVTLNATSQTISIFRNTGSVGLISFAPKVDFSTALSPQSIALADIDGDGKTDITFSNKFSNSFSVYRNISTSGTISLAARIDIASGAGNETYGISVADIDGDSKLDIGVVFSNSSAGGGLQLYRNTSTTGIITLSLNNSLTGGAVSNTYFHSAMNDLNGDGKVDVALTMQGTSGITRVYQNNSTTGSFSFGILNNLVNSFAPYGIMMGDLDGDGRADIIESEFTLDKISVFKNICGSPIVSAFSPGSGGTGAPITIFGLNFIGSTGVKFGGVAASAFSVINANQISATVGSGASGDVEVTNALGTGSLPGFIFAAPPTVTSFTPTSAATGTTVTITGTNFIGATAVNFGGVAASSFTIVNGTTITAIVGAGASGNVSVTNPYGTGSLAGFTYLPVPIISSFNPVSAGPGTTVTISGTNFTGSTAVTFGGVAAASFNVVNNTTITAVVGTGASGNVSVTNSFGTGSLAGFTFIPVPAITSFSPTTAGAGATITITGTGFTGVTSVRFGGQLASSFTVVNSTTITAVVSPSGASGAVSVIAPGGTGTLPGFIFIPAPEIISFSPVIMGPGGTVTITGNNFTGATAVSFGGIPAASFTVVSPTSISAVIGSGNSGSVSVTTPGGTAALAGFGFTTAPVIASVSPVSGPVGTPVTISGANFATGSGGNVVYFGAVQGSIVSSTPNSIVVNVPAGAMHKPVSVVNLSSKLTAVSDVQFTTTFPGGASAFDNNSFAARMDFTTGTSPVDADLGDLDGDGKPDIVVTNNNTSFISIFRNTSTGSILSFAQRTDITVASLMNDMVLNDINNDGKIDIIMARDYTGITPPTGSQIYILLNNSTPGNLSFSQTIIPTTDIITLLAIGDMNNDGKSEIIGFCGICAVQAGGYITVLENRTTGADLNFLHYRWNFSLNLLNNVLMRGVELRDINVDGKKDILVGLGSVDAFLILANNSTAGGIINVSSVTIPSFTIGGALSWPVPDDFDLDGNTDIVASGYILRHTGNFTFTQTQNTNNFPYGTSNDFNGDGKAELISHPFSGSNDKLNVLKNNSVPGTITFALPVQYQTAVSFIKFISGDLDADGKPEIISANRDVNSISIFRNRIAESLPPAPVIISFTPAIGGPLSMITITGTDLAQTTSVRFGGVPANFFFVQSSTTVIAYVGTGATGDVEVSTPGGTATKPGFTFSNILPTITSFAPVNGGAGTTVTITGTNFTGATSVSFGGIAAASFVVNSSTSISAVVGSGASGNLAVTTPNGTGSLPGFIFIPPPVITSFTPASAATGEAVTITGSNFTGATIVSFGGVPATSFIVNSSTSITAIVGTGASGPIGVTTPYGTGASTGTGFIFNIVTGIGNPANSNSKELKVNPNPSSDQVLIKHPSTVKPAELRFIDMLGREIKKLPVARNTTETPTTVKGFSRGIYQVLWSDGTRILSRTFLVD